MVFTNYLLCNNQTMKLYIYILPSLTSLVSSKPQNNPTGAGKECKVIEKATGQEKSCQFPFVFNDKTFHGCTTEDNGENEGKRWCSTKVDQLNVHDEFDSFFGECSEECLTSERGQKIEEDQEKLVICKYLLFIHAMH